MTNLQDRWRHLLQACALAGLAGAATAADSLSGLGAAFKPQAAPPQAAAARAAPPAEGNPAGAGAVAAVAASGYPGLRVVVHGKARALAYIDSQMVRVGDRVNGMRVTQIDGHGVVLKGEAGVTERLTVHTGVTKKTRVAAGTASNANGDLRP
jgi:hypothetical protein